MVAKKKTRIKQAALTAAVQSRVEASAQIRRIGDLAREVKRLEAEMGDKQAAIEQEYNELADPLRVHGIGDEASRAKRVRELISLVGLPSSALDALPGQLSGGQRQRVAIARALLGDPDVVVLDEATAAADPDSEWAVRKGLDALLEGRTKIIVAHRLHTIAHADRIVVLQHGDIAEQGTHNELVTTNGLYSSLASSMHRK